MSEQSLKPTGISDDDWQRINARIGSATESGIYLGLDQALHPCDLRVFSEQDVREMILKTTRHLPAGREFLLTLLDREKVGGLNEFFQQVNPLMRADGVLDLDDLKERHQDIVKELQAVRRLKNPFKAELTRRDMFSWGLAGLAVGAVGKNAVIGIDEALEPTTEKPEADRSGFQRVVHDEATIAKAVAPTIEVGLAAAVLADALRDRSDEKRAQITRAITLFIREARKGVQGVGDQENMGRGR